MQNRILINSEVEAMTGRVGKIDYDYILRMIQK